jgi:DNA polymerase-3 subunit delta'
MTTLQDIFGQDDAVETILRAYESDRLPHGLIFAGPAGVGKETAARAIATLFLCENPKKNQPCGKCASCALMESENPTHPDYHIIYRQLVRIEKEKLKAIDLPVSVIRDYLVEPANHKSSLNRGKVFIVREAELMNAAAQNAMLKTLEEPAGRTLIVLLTDQPHALLATVRSRCQIVRFAPLDTKLVERELVQRKIAKSTAVEAAELAEGSLGIALKWIEDGVVDAAGDLTKRLKATLAGKPAGDLADWFRKAADAYAAKQLERDKLSSKDQATREGLTLYLKIASATFRRCLSQCDDPEALERACAAIDAAARAESYLDSNVNVALTLQQFSGALERPAAGRA